MGVEFVRQEYTDNLPRWVIVDDTQKGELRVKARGETYLPFYGTQPRPKTAFDNDDDYKVYYQNYQALTVEQQNRYNNYLLDSIGHSYEFQFCALEYIADFKIGNCLIELDGRGHASRKAKDLIRDKRLCALGYNVVRIDQDCLLNFRAKNPVFRPHKLLSVIEELVPSFNIPATLPPIICKHRVIVRKPNPFIEVIY